MERIEANPASSSSARSRSRVSASLPKSRVRRRDTAAVRSCPATASVAVRSHPPGRSAACSRNRASRHVVGQEDDRQVHDVVALALPQLLDPLAPQLDARREPGGGDVALGEVGRRRMRLQPDDPKAGELAAGGDRHRGHARPDVEQGRRAGRQALRQPFELLQVPDQPRAATGRLVALGLQQLRIPVIPAQIAQPPLAGPGDDIRSLQPHRAQLGPQARPAERPNRAVAAVADGDEVERDQDVEQRAGDVRVDPRRGGQLGQRARLVERIEQAALGGRGQGVERPHLQCEQGSRHVSDRTDEPAPDESGISPR